ncbi:extracellular glycosidase Crh11p [[Candida] jaroonii]|uniref:Extracellular glycosidase Crh11p n=1 Tax=[Candida] jaroonii TaxID=467808 RepID=A0ACA9YEP4_9ASCO|nr:extracellular glycosidase Crh11p [[Candida] jaroonii]
MYCFWYLGLLRAILGCNPLQEVDCFVQNQALGRDIERFESKSFKLTGDVDITEEDSPEFKGANVKMSLNQRFDNPMASSEFYILYGKVECDIKASPGQGIISSFYLQSDDLDEIDIAELFGGNTYQFQSNFFIKGNTTTWDRGGYHEIRNPIEFYNRYTVEWTPESIKWWCNEQLIRVLEKDNDYGIPRSPMAIKLSLWAGGDPSNAEGTILWAGGLSDYREFPYVMNFRNLKVSDYSSGRIYSYGHKDGIWHGLSSDGVIGGRNFVTTSDYNFETSTDGFKGDENQFDKRENITSTTNDSLKLSIPINTLLIMTITITIFFIPISLSSI